MKNIKIENIGVAILGFFIIFYIINNYLNTTTKYLIYIVLGLVVIYILFLYNKDDKHKNKIISFIKNIPYYMNKFGSEDENKKIRKPIPNNIKKFVYKRANFSCQHCSLKEGLEIHHIDENPSNNRYYNLVLLCANCHKKSNSIGRTQLRFYNDR